MKKIIYVLSKRGNKLIVLSVILIIIGIKLCIADSCDNGLEVLIGRVVGISFFIGAIVSFVAGKGINSSEIKREREREEEGKKIANMRKEIKQEILKELGDKQNNGNKE